MLHVFVWLCLKFTEWSRLFSIKSRHISAVWKQLFLVWKRAFAQHSIEFKTFDLRSDEKLFLKTKTEGGRVVREVSCFEEIEDRGNLLSFEAFFRIKSEEMQVVWLLNVDNWQAYVFYCRFVTSLFSCRNLGMEWW